MAQLMPLPLTVSCSSKIQIGFTFPVPAYPGCPGKEAVKWLLLLVIIKADSKKQDTKASCRTVSGKISQGTTTTTRELELNWKDMDSKS